MKDYYFSDQEELVASRKQISEQEREISLLKKENSLLVSEIEKLKQSLRPDRKAGKTIKEN